MIQLQMLLAVQCNCLNNPAASGTDGSVTPCAGLSALMLVLGVLLFLFLLVLLVLLLFVFLAMLAALAGSQDCHCFLNAADVRLTCRQENPLHHQPQKE